MTLFANNNTALLSLIDIQVKKNFIYLNSSESISGIVIYKNIDTQQYKSIPIIPNLNYRDTLLEFDGGNNYQVVIVLKRVHSRRLLSYRRFLETPIQENKLYVSIEKLNDGFATIPSEPQEEEDNGLSYIKIIAIVGGCIGGLIIFIVIIYLCKNKNKSISTKTKKSLKVITAKSKIYKEIKKKKIITILRSIQIIIIIINYFEKQQFINNQIIIKILNNKISYKIRFNQITNSIILIINQICKIITILIC